MDPYHMPEAQLDPDDYWPRRFASMDKEEPDCEEQDRNYWDKYDNFGIDCNTKD